VWFLNYLKFRIRAEAGKVLPERLRKNPLTTGWPLLLGSHLVVLFTSTFKDTFFLLSAPIKGHRDACTEDTASFQQEAYGPIDADFIAIANADPQ